MRVQSRGTRTTSRRRTRKVEKIGGGSNFTVALMEWAAPFHDRSRSVSVLTGRAEWVQGMGGLMGGGWGGLRGRYRSGSVSLIVDC